MNYEIKYHVLGQAKMYKKTYNANSRCSAECKINIEHCKGILEGVKQSESLKIEYVREV